MLFIAILFVVFLVILVIRISFRKQESLNINNKILGRRRANNRLHHIIAHNNILTAKFVPHNGFTVLFFIVLVTSWMGWESYRFYHYYANQFDLFYVFSGLIFISQLLLAISDRPFKGSIPDNNYVVVIIPVYNEDESSLLSCFQSLISQRRVPDEIHVVDDGSTASYRSSKRYLLTKSKRIGIRTTWDKQPNKGKREAQINALRSLKTIYRDTIIITIDSDVVLDKDAIVEGLKPFANKHIQSVAGLVLAKNAHVNILSRLTDVLFVAIQQLVDRSAMSRLGNVLVNSGGLALYRLEVIRDAIDNGYLNEHFFGRKISMSDDSFLTLIALRRGKTVQQASAIVFTDMPITFDHHIRQQMRWMRGSFIRSWWRVRYLPLLSWGFMRQAIGWISFIINSLIFVYMIAAHAFHNRSIIILVILLPLCISYIQSIRYLCVQRSDVRNRQRLLVYSMAPLVALWSIMILRPLRWYAMLTCRKAGWGTRKSVENAGESTKVLKSVQENI